MAAVWRSGIGVPWFIFIDSTATTGRLPANAAATSAPMSSNRAIVILRECLACRAVECRHISQQSITVHSVSYQFSFGRECSDSTVARDLDRGFAFE
jgi:hypothetical protein